MSYTPEQQAEMLGSLKSIIAAQGLSSKAMRLIYKGDADAICDMLRIAHLLTEINAVSFDSLKSIAASGNVEAAEAIMKVRRLREELCVGGATP